MISNLDHDGATTELISGQDLHRELSRTGQYQSSMQGMPENLCAFCSSINFDQEFEFDPWRGCCVTNLPHISAPSPCKMCAFFRQMRSRDWKEGSGDFLWVASARNLIGSEDVTDASLFYVSNTASPWLKPTQYPVEFFTAQKTTSGGQGAAQLGSSANFAYLESPIAYCNTYHHDTCHKVLQDGVARLKVIDCQKRQLDTLPSLATPYVTLSYVWGAQISDDDEPFDILPQEVPRTIEDAIIITLRLGYRYLWVDRYCIPQKHCPEKNDLINQMGNIYASSTLTIVAACGEGSQSGIAGVSAPRTPHQPHLRVGDHQLQAIVVPKSDVGASKWATRGWTYQEGLLARRRLIFTENQVYFQCSADCSFESFPKTFPTKGRTEDLFLLYPDGGEVAASDLELWKRIQVYRRRNLSYNTDALPAFLGIMNRGSDNGKRFVHLHGLPLCLFNRAAMPPKAHDQALPYVIQSLLWRSCAGSRQRTGCPSWSWVGWQSVADDDSLLESSSWFDIGIATSSFVDIDIVSGKGNEAPVHFSAAESYGALRSFLSKVEPPRDLLLTGWCFDVTVHWKGHRRAAFRYHYASRVDETSMELKSPFPCIQWYDLGQRDVVSASEHLVGIIMRYGQHQGYVESDDYACLLLEHVDDQRFERVGMANFDFQASDYFTKDFTEALVPGIEKRTLHLV